MWQSPSCAHRETRIVNFYTIRIYSTGDYRPRSGLFLGLGLYIDLSDIYPSMQHALAYPVNCTNHSLWAESEID